MRTFSIIQLALIYEINIAYTLTYGGDLSTLNYIEKLKELTKIRLNRMIASEPIIEVI